VPGFVSAERRARQLREQSRRPHPARLRPVPVGVPGCQLGQGEQAWGEAGHEADLTRQPDRLFQLRAGGVQAPGRCIGEPQVADG
jgi:hypothetical protein